MTNIGVIENAKVREPLIGFAGALFFWPSQMICAGIFNTNATVLTVLPTSLYAISRCNDRLPRRLKATHGPLSLVLCRVVENGMIQIRKVEILRFTENDRNAKFLN